MKKYLLVILLCVMTPSAALFAYDTKEYACIDWTISQLEKLGCSKVSGSSAIRNAIRDLYNKNGCRIKGTLVIDPKTGAKLDQNKSDLCIAMYTPDSLLKKGGRFRTPKESINSHLRNKDFSGCEYDSDIKGEKDASEMTIEILNNIESGKCAALGATLRPSAPVVSQPIKNPEATTGDSDVDPQNNLLSLITDTEDELNSLPNTYYTFVEGNYRGKKMKVVVSANWEGSKKDEDGKTIYKFKYSTDGYNFYERLSDAVNPSFGQRLYRSIFSRTPSVADFENNITNEYASRLFGFSKAVDNTKINRDHIQKVAKLYIEERRAGNTPEQIFSTDSPFLLAATPLLPGAYKLEGNDRDEFEKIQYKGNRSGLENIYNQIERLKSLKQK